MLQAGSIRKLIQVNAPFTMLVEQYLELFLEQGFNPEIGLDARALDRYSAAQFTEVAESLHAQGCRITLHGPFTDLAAGSPDPLVRALTRRRWEQVLRLVPAFRPRTVVAHPGYDLHRYGFVREQWLEHSAAMWTWLAQRLWDQGVSLMLENVFEHGPEDMKPLFEGLPCPPVGFCLDVGHQAAFSRRSLEHWLEVLGCYLGQLHLHDNRGDRDAHLALGKGSIDFASLFDYLKAHHIDPPMLTLEIRRPDDLSTSLAYLQGLWPW